MNSDKTILVTGSSRGIGRAIALRLAKDGFDIVIHCRSGLEQAQKTKAEVEALGRKARIIQFDIINRKQTHDVLMADIEEFEMYYGIVCNAGLTRDNAYPAMSPEDWDLVVHTNLDGFFNVTHPLTMPLVRRRKPGRIVAISSVSGVIGNRGQVNYSASKAGLIGACKALAVELAKRAITVNCVAPGLIETDMIEDVPVEEALKMIPAKRMGKPEEVAAAVSFLMAEDAGYVTRQVISVNGGMC